MRYWNATVYNRHEATLTIVDTKQPLIGTKQPLIDTKQPGQLVRRGNRAAEAEPQGHREEETEYEPRLCEGRR